MQVSIEMWQVVVFVLTIVVGLGLYKMRKYLVFVGLISLPIWILAIPVYMVYAECSTREKHDALLGSEGYELRKNITSWEMITLQIVPYKVLKERQKVKDDAKKNYLEGK
jgi:energy-coupling factor transporter transmembrane protein EcfT